MTRRADQARSAGRGRRPASARHVAATTFAVAAVWSLGGCAGGAIEHNFQSARQVAIDRLGADVVWLTSEPARREAQAEVDRLLAAPLSADGAVRIALAYSPALQALLNDAAAAGAAASQSARLPNPVFAFERLARHDGAGLRELELTRAVSLSVVDLLLLPARLRRADARQQAIRLALAAAVVEAASGARRAWVDAVAAEQSVRYFEQVLTAAEAGAELARRMQAAGNFSRLQRAREQAFSADAVAQLARGRQAALAGREALVRVLGLDGARQAALRLPERLPDLPAAPLDEAAIAAVAFDQRLDLRMAAADLNAAAAEHGIAGIGSRAGALAAGPARKTETGRAPQTGFGLQLPLPLFDIGDAARAGADAAVRAAAERARQQAVDAASQVREQYGAYRTALDLARHFRDEVVPLRRAVADENLLRYNGMLIGVFELLADAREQIASVLQAIDAERDFWRADAALQAALIGAPPAGPASAFAVAPRPVR